MRPYFTRERFGRPQFLSGLLLLAFLAQALWLLHAELSTAPGIENQEAVRIGEGWKQWHGRGIAGAPFTEPASGSLQTPFEPNHNGFDRLHSPLIYLVSAAPLLAWPHDFTSDTSLYWRWLPRLPFLACGIFLGASLWYVSRRLCGNLGGFVAMTFYCFSPSFLQASAGSQSGPQLLAAWGAFGSIFTAVAVAHTLYAPREVVLWNWRRIVLLGVALAISIGTQFSMVILIPMALGFLFYVAPVRKQAGLVIWMAASIVGFVLFFATYFFHMHAIIASMKSAEFWGATWSGFTVAGVYKQIAVQLGRACPAFLMAIPVAGVTYVVWPRTRYFGNTGPLLVAVTFIVLAMAHPNASASGFLLASVPFLFIFVSGVLADLMETRYRQLVLACVTALLVTYVARTLIALAYLGHG